MRILIVEDEKKTAAYLHKGLSESGFVVEVAYDGDDGLYRAEMEPFDLIILDVMLPRRDGWSVIEALHTRRIDVPVLFLTARDAIDDRVKGLELGADDYLVKPFAFSELLARIRCILRRGPERKPDILRIGDLEIDLLRHEARRRGERLPLSPREFQLLEYLARSSGRVLTRTMILDHVWQMRFDPSTNVVDVHIHRLRAKVDREGWPPLIHTVRAVGYVLRADAG